MTNYMVGREVKDMNKAGPGRRYKLASRVVLFDHAIRPGERVSICKLAEDLVELHKPWTGEDSEDARLCSWCKVRADRQ